MAAKIKKGDTVQVLAGEDKGKSGRILEVIPATGCALVEGVNFVKKHVRRTQENPQGGVFEKEAPIHLSNLKKTD
ncbi:MAG TPA: 50S ribosomal protein L24 [Tichowtungia sp.]|nr:50S ribosomal protein L24 [Tichowtungia sp.]